MKEKILARLNNYKIHRQEWVDKQNSYIWTASERENGSEIFGNYQEKEASFTNKIVELEWVLSLIESGEKDLVKELINRHPHSNLGNNHKTFEI